MEHLTTSVLVIGKSGVGKSSLLNYMFDRQVEKVGVGAPVTPKGLYSHTYEYSDSFSINIYDTWGLEADKAEEWQQIIDEEMAKHDKMKISEWFNTIIYCLSAGNSRVENFEINMIKSLTSQNNNVVVALTHCKTQDPNENKGMVDVLVAEAGLERDHIINVSSVSQKLLGGITTTKFGRDELFSAILQNLWKCICGKLPGNIKNDVRLHLRVSRDEQIKKVNKKINMFSFVKDKFVGYKSPSETLEHFGEEISQDILDICKTANRQVNRRFTEANDYYFALYEHYNTQISEAKKLEIKLNMKCDFLKDYRKDIKFSFGKKGFVNIIQIAHEDINSFNEFKDVVSRLIEGFKINWTSVKKKREKAYETINACYDEIEQRLSEQIDLITSRINNAYYIE